MNNIPTWEQFIRFVLQCLSKGDTLQVHELKDQVANIVGLTEEQRLKTLPSGQPVAENRIAWAISYLNRVDAIERPQRGQYRITPIGRDLLARHPGEITEKDLRQLAKPDDQWWVRKNSTGTLKDASSSTVGQLDTDTTLDPNEQVEEGMDRINSEVSAELLSLMQGGEPAFFEQIVVDLLLAMGYGGAHGRGTVTQLTNDGGIDGIIDQDALGLNKIYVQAKRYGPQTSVRRPEVQSFVGALSGKADGGLFITTGVFSQGATDYARDVPSRIILIDGQQLTQLMIKYGVGVETKKTLKIVRIDEDYFA
ncbi:restriction endonuclease [Bifidobacterium sp. B4081]|uniref:restriction endonuclease n=1 Tax=unclassified Bifidobacterium TaxID=2608897 RepID=UPI002269BA91|nr:MULTISPECIES: restriction endonuclease [unclassified Bifidobacterium]MCX8643961.1 restriction endonuclease [Bifidobacterium sp. B4077]MCX8645049.1 restriction endonuclease [Bifidobacterium sp. B4081]MCX8668002.1 restriction endonuclease [Bifidobacterium sp. B3998]